MNENQNNNSDKSTTKPEVKSDSADVKKASFGSLSPLTTAQIITLLVGTTNSNSSYGGY